MVCWAAIEDEGKRIAHEWWPNAALPGQLGQELPLPMHFEQATSRLGRDDVAGRVICGHDADRHAEAIKEFADAGYEQVYVHQIAPDQDGFFDFYEKAVLPRFAV